MDEHSNFRMQWEFSKNSKSYTATYWKMRYPKVMFNNAKYIFLQAPKEHFHINSAETFKLLEIA